MSITGYTLYRGRSNIDGKPIVVIATLKTANGKTGDVVQTWILRRDTSALQAVRNGKDYSVCGDCLHRRMKSCYVVIGQAPNNISLRYARGGYPYLPMN